MTTRDKAKNYFYNEWYEVDSSIDYKCENVKKAMIAAYMAGHEEGKSEDE